MPLSDKISPSLQEKYKLVADTIRCYPLQIKQAWEEIKSSQIPDDYKNVDNIIVCGMGGSSLGARMVDSLASDRLRVPMEIFNDYRIPHYVNNKSLVIVSSYSGTTEETIESFYQAVKKGAKIFGITTGGELANLLLREKAIAYVFDPIHNPSQQPRMSIGYAFAAILAVLSKLSLISVSDKEIDEAISVMNSTLTEYGENVPSGKNLARSYAEKLKNKIPVLIASEHLVGTLHTVKNQFNESAKTFSLLFDLPELNHHLMEGLQNPKKLRDMAHFVFVNSDLYNDKVKKRYSLTADVVGKNYYSYDIYSPRASTRLGQTLETLVFGSYVAFFLTQIYLIDPLDIPWVDYFKKQLAK